jgi:hypothetical protein
MSAELCKQDGPVYTLGDFSYEMQDDVKRSLCSKDITKRRKRKFAKRRQ